MEKKTAGLDSFTCKHSYKHMYVCACVHFVYSVCMVDLLTFENFFSLGNFMEKKSKRYDSHVQCKSSTEFSWVYVFNM